MPLTMMSSREEESLRFFKYVEDSGLKAYGGVATRNLVWNEKSKIVSEKNDKKRKQEEVAKRTSEEVAVEGKHLRMGSASMSEQQQFSVRSQSLNSVGGLEEEEGSPNSRKQPPPKPRRDPSTKLSTSSEAVDHSATTCKGGHFHKGDVTQGCSEECRRVPPPKPKRNPNTQLSTSFDESYILNSKDSPPMALSPISPVSPPQPQSPHQDLEEPVYIEMSGNAVRDTPSRSEPEEEPGEAVYEEMKYPAFDDFDSRWDLIGYRSQNITPCPSDMDIHASINYALTPRSASYCDIPAPFPNLLSHRPPLLVFPPVPAQCSPNSDESPLTPVDVNKLAMLENAAYSKSPSTSSSSMEPLSSASSSHLRRAERELTATPTITISGRSSAPPLPCALYRGSSSSGGVQRSHSACPSPVSMGRCLTPLSLMRGPPIEGSFSGGALPRHHSSTQNVATGRSRTPTSPLDELTNLFTSGRNMLKKSSSGRKSKDPSESEAKGKVHGSESKKEHKEKSHKESKKDKERSGKSSHRRESKDREPSGIEALQRRDSKERTGSNSEPIVRHDSKDRGSNVEAVPKRSSKERTGNVEPVPRHNSKDKGSNVELVPRRNSKDRGSSIEALPRRNSKDKGNNVEPVTRRNSRDKGTSVEPVIRRNSKDKVCSGPELLPKKSSRDRGCSTSEPIVRHDSKDWINTNIEPLPTRDSRDRICNGSELMLRQDSRDFLRNGVEQHDSRDRICYGPELITRHSGKDQGRTGLEGRRNSKEGRKYSNSNMADSGWDCMERMSNGTDVAYRRDYKDKGNHITEHHHKSKDKSCHGTESPKAHDWDTRSGPSPSFSSRSRRSPVSPTTMMGNSEFKMIPKVAQFLSTPLAPSASGTPQRRPSEAQELPMPPFPWLCGDSTMMETIERKQRLCREIRTRQRPPEQSQMESMPSCKKANGQKKYGPPPYPSQTTVFWDTAI